MPEPKLDELTQPLEQPESVKNNPLTFIKGGLLETEDQTLKEFTPEDIVLLTKQVKEIKTDLHVFAEALQKVEKSEQAYPGVPFLTVSEKVTLNNEDYQDLNRGERGELDMSVDRVSILVNRKNYEVLNRYLKRLESLLSDSSITGRNQ